jgi:hypothetical protein
VLDKGIIMKLKPRLWALCAAGYLAVSPGGTAWAQEGWPIPEDTDKTVEVLEILFAHAPLKIPDRRDEEEEEIIWQHAPGTISTTNCYSERAQWTIGSLLANFLPNDGLGKHDIIGQCFGEDEKECGLMIHHHSLDAPLVNPDGTPNFNEYLYSFSFYFKTRANKIQMDSLFCFYTP